MLAHWKMFKFWLCLIEMIGENLEVVSSHSSNGVVTQAYLVLGHFSWKLFIFEEYEEGATVFL